MDQAVGEESKHNVLDSRLCSGLYVVRAGRAEAGQRAGPGARAGAGHGRTDRGPAGLSPIGVIGLRKSNKTLIF